MTSEEWQTLQTDFTTAYQASLNDPEYLSGSLRVSHSWNLTLSRYKSRVLEAIPGSLLTSFWFLTLDSVYFPAKSYEEKIEEIKVTTVLLRRKWNLAEETKETLKNSKLNWKNSQKSRNFNAGNSKVHCLRTV